MGLERYVVDAVLIEKRSPTEIARAHGISRSWLYVLLARVRGGGYEALAPHSRRPRSSPRAAGDEVIATVLQLRQELLAAGHDAGPQTISHHVAARLAQPPSRSTIWRILSRHGLITPQPHKRPRSSFVRFEASLPNERWQADATEWLLADGAKVEILNFVDDHSRLFVASVAFTTVKAADALETFLGAASQFGFPASLLTDNAAVFSGKSRKGRVLLESELDRLGIVSKHSTPYHPQTCGKVERLHQSLKRFLTRQPPATCLPELQAQLDAFRFYYNQSRPHRALAGRTPAQAFAARVKAGPAAELASVQYRVRHDRIDKTGAVTLRYRSRLRHISVGAAHRNKPVRLLVAGAQVRIVTEAGELLRALTIDPTRDYQPRNGRWPVHNVLRQASGIS
ncbi:MAG TPA: IS481 family transposase [Candidatus Dormibacteraeota bacterium]